MGVEREPEWVPRRPAARPRGFRYVQGDAEALPFDDATFDLVTCQTVLIHVADPRAVIREFDARHQARRAGDRRRAQQPRVVPRRRALPTTRSTSSRFVLACERGKIALGEGDNSVGDLVPGYFAEAGLTDIEIFHGRQARRRCSRPTRPRTSRR